MDKTSRVQSSIDIAQELKLKNFEKVIDYANGVQEEIIHNWQMKNRNGLEHLILVSRNILNFWTDSIVKKRLWVALVRCGAWIGTLETIEKSVYEESMDRWLNKRISKKISSVKNLPEIVQLLEIKGIMTHGELTEALGLNHPSTLTEIIKKTTELEIIAITKSGKYNLYSLTDAGIRYAKQMRAEKNEKELLKNVIDEYDLRINEALLDNYLRKLNDFEESTLIKREQDLKVKIDNDKIQNVKVDNILKNVSYNNEEESCLVLKTIKTAPKEPPVKEKPALSIKAIKTATTESLINYEMGA